MYKHFALKFLREVTTQKKSRWRSDNKMDLRETDRELVNLFRITSNTRFWHSW
jgi:hypothetical protein